VFIPECEAVDLAQLRCALYREQAATWGEFKERIPPRRWQEAVAAYLAGEESVPAADDPFDPNQVPGYGDGDWPEWPAQRMLEWMPEDIRQRFGEIATSVFNSDFLEIDPRSESEVVAALKGAGYTCIRDDHLVELASGY
jgi:hypothetical protein